MPSLTHKNALLIAAQAYDNPRCASYEEFLEDVRRLKYIKRLLRRYVVTGELKEQLVLNHLITLYNCFDAQQLTPLLFLKMDTMLFPALKTLLTYLNRMPSRLHSIEGLTIRNEDIELDTKLWERLETL
jgi:hypothetical protein